MSAHYVHAATGRPTRCTCVVGISTVPTTATHSLFFLSLAYKSSPPLHVKYSGNGADVGCWVNKMLAESTKPLIVSLPSGTMSRGCCGLNLPPGAMLTLKGQGGGGINARVNGRWRDGLADEPLCAKACDMRDACAGYSYVGGGNHSGRCFLYGHGLDNVLSSEPWNAYVQQTGVISRASGASTQEDLCVDDNDRAREASQGKARDCANLQAQELCHSANPSALMCQKTCRLCPGRI